MTENISVITSFPDQNYFLFPRIYSDFGVFHNIDLNVINIFVFVTIALGCQLYSTARIWVQTSMETTRGNYVSQFSITG